MTQVAGYDKAKPIKVARAKVNLRGVDWWIRVIWTLATQRTTLHLWRAPKGMILYMCPRSISLYFLKHPRHADRLKWWQIGGHSSKKKKNTLLNPRTIMLWKKNGRSQFQRFQQTRVVGACFSQFGHQTQGDAKQFKLFSALFERPRKSTLK